MGSAARSGTTQRLSSASIKSLPSSPKSTAWLCVQRVYRLARKGRELAIAAKPVRIHRLLLTAYDCPRLALDVECSTGTFIRAIGRDLAAAPAAVKASPSAAIAACDEAGELVGILQPHSSGAWRLRPNFRGTG